MIGASGTFTNLHYPNQAEVPGLFDSSSQGGSAFYAYRVSRRCTTSERPTSIKDCCPFRRTGRTRPRLTPCFSFYSFSPSKRFSLSMFGGPQYSDIGPQFVRGCQMSAWFAVLDAGRRSQHELAGTVHQLALSYAHTIAGGGGLIGAVQMDSCECLAPSTVQSRPERVLSRGILAEHSSRRLAPVGRRQHQRALGFRNSLAAASSSASI